MAKNLVSRYVWLVETIYRAGRISFEDINKKYVNDFEEDPIPLRTFHKWRIAAEEMLHLNIECERKGGYHYYIGNRSDVKSGSLRSWLLSTLSVSNLLLDSQSLKDRILLEEVPHGQEELPVILDAMKSSSQLSITYQSFNRDESNTFNVHPYCIKLFKQRWYLVAYSPYYEKIMVYALDRILNILKLDGEKFDMPEDFNASEYFEDCYGIIAGTNTHVESVKLKVKAGQACYLRTLPLHRTQEEVETAPEYSIFQLHLRPEFDFIQELLCQGEDIEVLEPLWLRKKIGGIIKRMSNNYNSK